MLNGVERDLDEQLDAMLLAGGAGDDEVVDGKIVGDPEDTADDDADEEFEDAGDEDEDEDEDADEAVADPEDASKE